MLTCCWVRLRRLSLMFSFVLQKTMFPCPASKSSALMVEITICCPTSETAGQVWHLQFACSALCTQLPNLLCLYHSAVWNLCVSDWDAAGNSYVHHTVRLPDHVHSTVQPYLRHIHIYLQGWEKTHSILSRLWFCSRLLVLLQITGPAPDFLFCSEVFYSAAVQIVAAHCSGLAFL